ncbi:MAG: glycosyl transferase family 36 [bacterium]|nr:glycosyl transferase family 36 [bacterium]
MTRTVSGQQVDVRKGTNGSPVGNAYGHFSEDGREFRITNWRTPRPWTNIIANPRVGLAVSQTGSGFSWIDNSQLAVITRWQQDSVQDTSGKFLYVRDVKTGKVWSLSPAPTFPDYVHYECRHGIGYTTFVTEFDGIRGEWTLFVPPEQTAELWQVKLTNVSGRSRQLSLCPDLEWCCGVAPDPRREFTKLFLETTFEMQPAAILARNHMWDVPSDRFGHWNTEFPFVAALGTTLPIDDATGDKAAFAGMYNGLKEPAALAQGQWPRRFGRHDDPIAAIRSSLSLDPGQTRTVGYVLAVSTDAAQTSRLVHELADIGAIEAALAETRQDWQQRLASQRVDTPDESINCLANDWLRYQAISGRMWGRCGYYQQSGAFGFRDQLQDSQVWLTIDPPQCRQQIMLHAGRQFADGSVYHWWHPLTEQGLRTQFSDDLLWLAFVTANYVKHTGDFQILDEPAPFVDAEESAPLIEHVRRAFARAFERTSARGLPFIGAGDWNDGLSAAGIQEKGESIWLGHLLVGLLADWAEVHRRRAEDDAATDLAQRREHLIAAINEHGWDDQWYLRATLDDGTKLGTSQSERARIFLNAQTWAVLNDVAPPDRAASCMRAVREHLVTEVGPLLLTPAFTQPNPQIGYITRYAPGLRENGGVYTHAACWAIAAACKVGDAELAGRLRDCINPARRDPDRYWAEPYVLPGNVDGPESPHFGRGGWTWYTGAAAWLQRVIREWVLGVRPEWDGLRVQPCLPPDWSDASLHCCFRGADYRVDIERRAQTKTTTVILDGDALPDTLVPPPGKPGEQHVVRVQCG